MSDTVAGTLWTTPGQFTGKAIKATAAYAGIKIAYPASYIHFEDNYKPDFVTKFPYSKVPAWEGADGFTLFESAPIARYIASLAPESGLLGKTAKEAALIDQWIHLMEEANNYTENIELYIQHVLTPYSKSSHELFVQYQIRALRVLNSHLAQRTFLVGDALTLADIFIAALVLRACGINIATAERAKLPHLVRHMEMVLNQPVFVEAGIFPPIPVLDKAGSPFLSFD
ncbi:glutathione S-transferase C-terminal-like protein [Roridomyces roridus]|uniref:Glutathione S-transferase C-terminal-like protein n=1 Tax=Roridomyces roridus TaxID=1738132 RepID=A0AAD7BRW9_9AGAR|nr:glutathione S-transferase C-terminal-like protein [Roridomyces roridus]